MQCPISQQVVQSFCSEKRISNKDKRTIKSKGIEIFPSSGYEIESTYYRDQGSKGNKDSKNRDTIVHSTPANIESCINKLIYESKKEGSKSSRIEYWLILLSQNKS
jgi:hypothetical protein